MRERAHSHGSQLAQGKQLYATLENDLKAFLSHCALNNNVSRPPGLSNEVAEMVCARACACARVCFSSMSYTKNENDECDEC